MSGARKGNPLTLNRVVGLDTSVKMLGTQATLADVLGIEVRSLRDKLSGARGISDADLFAAAAALDARAERIAAHAAKLRAEVAA